MILLCLGRRELGKTTFARYVSGRCDRAIILDPRAMWQVTDPIGDLPQDETELIARLEDGQKTIVIQPQDDLDATANRLSVILRSYLIDNPIAKTQTWAIVIDECALIEDLKNQWSWWWRCSPRDRVWLILTSHRPQDVPTTIRALTDYWACFRMMQEHDLTAIEDRCGKDFCANLRRMKEREFLLWDDSKGTMVAYLDPKVWYAPLEADTITIVSGSPLPAGESLRLF